MIKIMVPIDGSEQSAKVISQLLKSVALYKEPVELHVLNVQPPVPYANKVSHAVGHEIVDEYLREQAELALKQSLSVLDAARIPYKKHIETGETAEVILRVAGENACSQIFMGTHGRGAVAGLLLGSVATKVLHLSSIPVTVVR